ncbi:YbjN domain-containing protein [Corynebacterium sp. CCM 9204]|uniref:YbjN domain-containing protein n=1 Tax=Corynebacterium sp. CCM 9204 TaxID=3057616 RepID=UPI003524B453
MAHLSALEHTSQLPEELCTAVTDKDNIPTPVDLDRVAEILDGEGLKWLREEESPDVLRTGFPNAAFGFFIRDDKILADAMWRATPPRERAPELLAAVNEWNLTQITPILHFSETPDGALSIYAHRRLLAGHGATRNQIGAFTMSTLELTVNCFNWLGTQFPDLVTWQEHNHEQ